jgi:hypothetical protein
MAETKGTIKKPGEGQAVTSVTEEVPHEADSTSAPTSLPDDVNRPPVSTNDPEVPIAHSLVAGAGASTGEPKIHPETHVASNAYVTGDEANVVPVEVEGEATPAKGK